MLVDDIPQNQATQGHGEGLSRLAQVSAPELVDDVDIVNGPFSAEYGDFSALGVIHIRLRRSASTTSGTLRAQGGSFDGYRTLRRVEPAPEERRAVFLPGSTRIPMVRSSSRCTTCATTSPAITRFHLGRRAVRCGFRSTAAATISTPPGKFRWTWCFRGTSIASATWTRVTAGMCAMDPASVYYRSNPGPNDTLRADGYLVRSLFDLFSDFTFYLNDPVNGDGIQQHDSRLQEGAQRAVSTRARLLGSPSSAHGGSQPHRQAGSTSTSSTPKTARSSRPVPGQPWTEANVHITQSGLLRHRKASTSPHLHLDAGLRFDDSAPTSPIAWSLPTAAPASRAARAQADHCLHSPSARLPPALHFNFRPRGNQPGRARHCAGPAAPKRPLPIST